MNIKETIDLLSDVTKNGGAFCIHCGTTYTTIRETRKHLLAEHYAYCLAQCNGDKEQLKKWADLP